MVEGRGGGEKVNRSWTLVWLSSGRHLFTYFFDDFGRNLNLSVDEVDDKVSLCRRDFEIELSFRVVRGASMVFLAASSPPEYSRRDQTDNFE